jgi:hypothetical protein
MKPDFMKQGIIVSKTTLRRIAAFVLMVLASGSAVRAQFGGSPGDVVFYAVTANGSGAFQTVPITTTNTAAGLAAFHTTVLSTVPISLSLPFPLLRQVLYQTTNELFQVSTDAEGNVGLHRLFLVPTKLFSIAGVIDPPGPGSSDGLAGTYIAFPQGLDVTNDLVLEKLMFVTWPFLQVVTQRGSVGPPNLTGWQYLFTLPNAVTLPALLPWANMSTLYPTGSWLPGVDLKMIETDTTLGATIRMIRLRAGAKTPLFNCPGHTHLFVLQGSAQITPVGGATVTMNQNDYAYVPEGFTISLANPAAYTGPVSK